ncbi:serine hydrolase domain-containing protein [Hymenobacter ruricola]|uniref:Beta-lactamase family protein n=1 Tax=Hymenobacter ruricola TaxID=2791023 RepID=A0ABS0I327_9BACT|nr:serine hydrolase domain-containing protein [Hymenobacter ruricola]MBF9221350.1 beta-lactamase family protein [Hymenobacter ruricola]
MKKVTHYFTDFLLFALLAWPATNAHGQDRATGRLDSLFRSLAQHEELNGSVLIARQGRPIYQQSFGFARFAPAQANDRRTGFALASVAKVFTATAVLQLRDRGRLALDEPLKKYLPEFPYSAITIRQLLSHTSGLPDYELYEAQMDANPGKVFTNQDVLPALKKWKKPLGSRPGEKWEYSNTNYLLLALLVEETSGLRFQHYVQKHIFGPVGMKDTYFSADPARVADEHRAANYEYPYLYSARLQNVDSLAKYHWRLHGASGFVGQGNVTTTPADMLRFDDALYQGRLLKAATLAEAFTPTKLLSGHAAVADLGLGQTSYGLGWMLFLDSAGSQVVGHTGGQPGALSIFLRDLTHRQTVVLFDNAFHRGLYRAGLNALNLLQHQPTVARRQSLGPVYGRTLVAQGADAAFCKWQELKADSIHYVLRESDLNSLGLQLLHTAAFDQEHRLALEVLRTNILLFPASFNTYDSYGEGLALAGKRTEAIQMYRQSIALNPGNEAGKRALVKLLDDPRQPTETQPSRPQTLH